MAVRVRLTECSAAVHKRHIRIWVKGRDNRGDTRFRNAKQVFTCLALKPLTDTGTRIGIQMQLPIHWPIAHRTGGCTCLGGQQWAT